VSEGWTVTPDRGPLLFELGPLDRTDGRPAAFLDRDGILNEAVADPVSGVLESPLDVRDVRLSPGAPIAADALARAGYALICVSNQPAAAKGKVTIERLQRVHERVVELLAREGVRLDGSLLCPHHPDGVVPGLSGPCECRKPAPGMLLRAAHALNIDMGASWMLGDTDVDVLAGRAAGCRTALIAYPGSSHKRFGHVGEDLLAADLADGATNILGEKIVKL